MCTHILLDALSAQDHAHMHQVTKHGEDDKQAAQSRTTWLSFQARTAFSAALFLSAHVAEHH